MAYSSSLNLERDANKQFVIDATVESSRKSTLVAYVLWFLFGGLGIHNFYLGKPVLAGLQLFGVLFALFAKSFDSLLGILALLAIVAVLISLFFDLFLIPSRVRTHSERLRTRLEERAGWE